jgi:hypothetical protein
MFIRTYLVASDVLIQALFSSSGEQHGGCEHRHGCQLPSNSAHNGGPCSDEKLDSECYDELESNDMSI